MASPLSPLSPSTQNSRRGPLAAHGGDNLDLTSPDAPAPLFTSRTDGKRASIYDNDENVSPITKQKRLSMHVGTPSPGPTSDKVDSRAADEDSLEGPPSSPFQESVVSEHTTAMTTHAAHTEDDGNGYPEQTPSETGDVETGGPQSQPVQVELHNRDVGNEAIHEAQYENDGVVNVDSADSSVVRHEHQQMDHKSSRKVSNMTVDNENMSAVYHQQKGDTKAPDADGTNDNYDTGDDTCLSTFSAVPNADMTLFSKVRADSPAKRLRETLSPKKVDRPSHLRETVHQTPGSAGKSSTDNNYNNDTSAGVPDLAPPIHDSPRAGSPTPRRKYPRMDDSFNLLELTDQFNAPSQLDHADGGEANRSASPSRRVNRRSPTKKSPVKMDLLDFDIPPAPTPRSTPTITPRELESLKSSLLSEISSLKATLSGRDAEVVSLKEAVAAAERRAGEALEEVRNEASRKEALESEQQEWERRGKEMETVLRNVKADIVEGEREKERLTKKSDDAEKAKEQLEARVVELESQLSAAREATSAADPAATSASPPDNEQSKISTADTAKEVQDAVEKVARELHSLYKSKHESKVAALKKSYEARWEKRVREAENKLREATEEIERLKTERDAAASGASGAPPGDTTILRESEELEAQKRVLEAKVTGLEQELLTLKQDSETLRSELKSERTEKGELVAVVDEWLAMQHEQCEEQQQQQEEQDQETRQLETQKIPSLQPPTPRQVQSVDDDEVSNQHGDAEKLDVGGNEKVGAAGGATGGVSCIPGAPAHPPSSNARPRVAPGMTPKVPRFGIPGGHTRGNSGGEKNINSGIGRIPAPGRSGIMSSIERMGRRGG